MKEVKKPRKSLLFYYVAIFVGLILFNLLAMPNIVERKITEVDYGTFMSMTADKNIGLVEIQQNRIVFTDKEQKNIYKTGILDDVGLIERLHESGAEFSAEIVEETSPLLTFVLSWVFPIIFFILIGNVISRVFMKKAAGNNSMMFNAGKSNAKV